MNAVKPKSNAENITPAVHLEFIQNQLENANGSAAERHSAHAHPHAAAFSELEGVAQQVEQNLPQARWITDQSVLRAWINLCVEHKTLSQHLRTKCI